MLLPTIFHMKTPFDLFRAIRFAKELEKERDYQVVKIELYEPLPAIKTICVRCGVECEIICIRFCDDCLKIVAPLNKNKTDWSRSPYN